MKARTRPILVVITGAALILAFAQLAVAQFTDAPTYNGRSYGSGLSVENPKPGLSSPPWQIPPELKPESTANIRNSNSPGANEYEPGSSFALTNTAFMQVDKKPAAEAAKKPEKTYPDFKVTGFFST